MFKVGKKVVCIDADGVPASFGLVKDEIYTVLEIKYMTCCGAIDLDVGLVSKWFYEEHCVCGQSIGDKEPGEKAFFPSRRFRPVDYDFAESVIESLIEEPVYV